MNHPAEAPSTGEGTLSTPPHSINHPVAAGSATSHEVTSPLNAVASTDAQRAPLRLPINTESGYDTSQVVGRKRLKPLHKIVNSKVRKRDEDVSSSCHPQLLVTLLTSTRI